MRDISGKHIWPEPEEWLFGFVVVAMVLLVLAGWTYLVVGIGEAIIWTTGAPDLGLLGIPLGIVVGYLILCIPGLIAGRPR